MKKHIIILAVLFVGLLNFTFTLEAENQKVVVLSENFDGFTGGTIANPATPSTIPDQGTGGLDVVTQTPGWVGYLIYPAAGTIKLSYTGITGYITTPSLDLSADGGKFYVKFKTMTYVGDTTKIHIYVDNVEKIITEKVPNATTYTLEEFVEFGPYEITGGTSTSKIKFSGVTINKAARFYLDDLEIYNYQQTTALSNVKTESVVYVSNEQLNIKAPLGQNIEVFNAFGQRVIYAVTSSEISSFSLEKNQIYLVKVGNKVSKIVL